MDTHEKWRTFSHSPSSLVASSVGSAVGVAAVAVGGATLPASGNKKGEIVHLQVVSIEACGWVKKIMPLSQIYGGELELIVYNCDGEQR